MLRASLLAILLLFATVASADPSTRWWAGRAIKSTGNIPPPPTPAPTPTATPAALPADYLAAKTRWESNMTTVGATFCENSEGSEAGSWYYDGLWVYQQIRTYTGNTDWDTCVTHHRTFYKNLIDSQQTSGTLAGRRAFAIGLDNAGETTYISKLLNDTTYANLFHNCSDGDSSHSVWPNTTNSGPSREVSFLLRTLLAAERNALTSPFSIDDIDPADQCTNLGNSHVITSTDALAFVKWHADRYINDSIYVQSFMAALTASALIDYEENNPGVDVAVPVLIKGIADFLWANTWDATNNNFQYCWVRADGSVCLDADDDFRAINLSQLIAPMYAWLYKKGYGQLYADRFDDIFIPATYLDDPATSGIIEGVDLTFQGKHFTQNYRESIRAVAWRETTP